MDTPEQVARKALNAVRRERAKRKKAINAEITVLARAEAKREAEASYQRMLADSRDEAEALAKAASEIDDIYFPRFVRFWPRTYNDERVPQDFGVAEPDGSRGTESMMGEALKTASDHDVGDGKPLTNITHPNTLSWWGRLRFWLWDNRYK